MALLDYDSSESAGEEEAPFPQANDAATSGSGAAKDSPFQPIPKVGKASSDSGKDDCSTHDIDAGSPKSASVTVQAKPADLQSSKAKFYKFDDDTQSLPIQLSHQNDKECQGQQGSHNRKDASVLPELQQPKLRPEQDVALRGRLGESSDDEAARSMVHTGAQRAKLGRRPVAEASTPFSEVIDIYISQMIASGSGAPPPEYKAEICGIYEDAPPDGKEEMHSGMLETVLDAAEEQAQKEEEEARAQKRARLRQEQEAKDKREIEHIAAPARGTAAAKHQQDALSDQVIAFGDASAQPNAVAQLQNPVVFFEIGVNGNSIGRIEMELFADVVPRTAENFRCLCTSEKGCSQSGHRLTFDGSTFHRIIPGFMCQGGDFTRNNGTGGESIYGKSFADENFDRKHKRGSLSMANSGPNTNGSQFFICTDATSHLDGKHVVFGEVKTGYEVVQKMEALGSSSGRTRKTVMITNCGMASATNLPASKRPRFIDVAPAARIAPAEEIAPAPAGGLLGLLAQRDEGVHTEADSQAAPIHFSPTGGEVHVLHILRKHIGSRKPLNRMGQKVTCRQEEAEEYLDEIANQFVGLPPVELRKQFADLARTESDCGTAKKGGDNGRFRRGQRDRNFEEAAFSLEVGEMSDIVVTPSGVHLILRVG